MKLSLVLKDVSVNALPGEDPEIGRVTCHSNDTGPGAIFFAFKGDFRDGNDFIADARGRGCRVVVSEKEDPCPGMIALRAADARLAMARAAGNLFGHPINRLLAVGITGTNGKTTTSYLIDAILRGETGKRNILGTIRHFVQGRETVSRNTTPESFQINAFLTEALAAGAGHMVMEVSSHALKLHKVHGMAFPIAVFTNFTRDHMDFHGSEEDYFSAKRRLFTENLAPGGTAVINADDPKAGAVLSQGRGPALRYGRRDALADIRPLSARNTKDGMQIRLATPQGPMDLSTRLKGPFNVYNVMAACGAGLAAGRTPDQIARGIARVDKVDGRFEAVDAGQAFNVIVDYAHTPDALENLLAAARQITQGRVITVFGCGGDRDPGKRPLMGGIAERLGDFAVVTADNPRTEPPGRILEGIRAGMRDKARFCVIADREQAIAKALRMARPGDSVVIAGKGHETYQILGKERIHFDDREIARKYLETIKRAKGAAAHGHPAQ